MIISDLEHVEFIEEKSITGGINVHWNRFMSFNLDRTTDYFEFKQKYIYPKSYTRFGNQKIYNSNNNTEPDGDIVHISIESETESKIDCIRPYCYSQGIFVEAISITD